MRLAPLSSAVLLALVALSPIGSTPALAQDTGAAVFQAGPVVEMLPAGTIVGDGETTVALHVTALGVDGNPLSTADKWKLTASAGVVEGPTDLGNGVLEFQYTPPAVEKSTSVSLTLKGRAPSGTIDKAWAINVVGGGPTGIATTANPARVLLGQDTSASLSIRFTGPLGTLESTSGLRVAASTGTVSNVTYLGSGQFTARFEPPEVNFPQLALLTFVDARDPAGAHGTAVVPLVGKANFPVKADPGSTVLLRIGGQDFGPVTADASGRASIPITVSPGVQTATLVTAMGGRSTEREIDLQVPETPRITMFPMHAGLPADGHTQVPVRAFVTTAEGEPAVVAKVAFTTSAGTMEAAVHEGNGVYRALFTPTAAGKASTATVSAQLQGQEGQTASTDVHLVPPRAAGIALRAEPTELGSGVTAFKIFARVSDAAGNGITGQQLLLTANNASVTGEVRDLKGGDYEAVFTTDAASERVNVGAAVAVAPAGNSLRYLVVFAADERIAPNGSDTTTLSLVTVDVFGHPVANVPVTLRLLVGDGSLPSQVTTDARGLSQVRYTAGRQAGVVSILATSSDISGGAALLQVEGGVLGDVTLPTSGTVRARSLAQDWAGLVTELPVARQGVEAAPIAAVVESSGESGPLASFAVSSQPASAAAGGTVLLRIEGRDANGRTVAGVTPELLVTQGTLGPLSDLGGGAWQAALTVPAGATADTKVVVTDAAGTVTQLTVVPTVADAGSAWVGAEPAGSAWGATEPTGSTTSTEAEPVVEPTPEPEPVAEAEPTAAETVPRTPSDRTAPWLRARAGWAVGSYVYAQTPEPTVENNRLWEKPVSLGGQGALTWQNGFAIDVAAWGDEVPSVGHITKYVGVEAEYRMAAYRARWPGSSAIITDWVPQVRANVMGRYPFSAGVGDFHVAIKVGYLYGDFVTYLRGSDDGTIEFGPLGLHGLGLGAEIAADLMEGKLHFQAGILQGLRGMLPYSTNVDLEVSYELISNVFVHAGYGLTVQSIPVLAQSTQEELGTLSDRSSLFVLGVGYQL